MEKQYEKLLDSLYGFESGRLHYNSKEKDITNAYGMYRFQQPKAELWKYIDSLAVGITTLPSNQWTKDIVEKVNAKIDKAKERELTYQFYKSFFAKAHLELFHEDLVILIVNLYTNSPLGAIKSIQEALNDCYEYGIFKIAKEAVPEVVGTFGPKTQAAVKLFSDNADEKDIIIFKNCALLYMKSFYGELAVDKSSTMLINLKGWNNRMEALQHQE